MAQIASDRSNRASGPQDILSILLSTHLRVASIDLLVEGRIFIIIWSCLLNVLLLIKLDPQLLVHAMALSGVLRLRLGPVLVKLGAIRPRLLKRFIDFLANAILGKH